MLTKLLTAFLLWLSKKDLSKYIEIVLKIGFIISYLFLVFYSNNIFRDTLYLVIFGPISYFQNVIFTVVSRSRNSGAPKLHLNVAYFSNGIWYINQFWMITMIWAAIKNGQPIFIFCAGCLYILSTAKGSAKSMELWQEYIEIKDESYKVGGILKKD